MAQVSEFDQFWARYPRKVGRLIAQKKFVAARQHASFADLMRGVERYVRTKPAWQEWCHPSTWLVQGRWLDEEVVPLPLVPRWTALTDCPHVVKCGSWFLCDQKTTITAMKQQAKETRRDS